MTLTQKRACLVILAIICVVSIVVGNTIADDGVSDILRKPAPYTGQKVDDEGNLIVPFDIAYPEAFASSDCQYDKSSVLLKLAKGTNDLSQNLKNCGFTSIDKFSTAKDGDWYRAKLKGNVDIHQAVAKARNLSEVMLVDYDYIYTTESTLASSQSDSQSDTSSTEGIISGVLGNGQVKNQWYLKSSGIQDAWRLLESNGIPAGGLSSTVVAVIDTGVDYNHPDLEASMWVNTAEIPGNGIDDDGNGYVDDIHGVDTIASTGNPMDDHGHGTHVAGIIGATNNKEGIVGVAYNAKIMAVKAGQATGVFNQSDIAEAILYAYEMGADVINMSFGGSTCSIAVQDALQTAYTRSTLVASAGNNGMPNELTDYYLPFPNYPAALSYVIGVMSVDPNGVESYFTNWDARAFNNVEYEIYAPGEQILSTLPGEKYGVLSGTSMAAPIVSGAAALLRSYYVDRDMYPSKFIAAQISATSEDTAYCINLQKHAASGQFHNLPMILNVYDSLTKLPKPDVNLYDYLIFDSPSVSDQNNGDGVVDAGETLEIGTVLRNRWGMSKNTVVTIDAIGDLGIVNPYVQILTGTTNLEGVGTYSQKDNYIKQEDGKVTGVENPLVVKIADNCPNDYRIVLNVTVTFENGLDEDDDKNYETTGVIEFWVRNGVVLTGQITEDQTWTKDKLYIIGSLYINEGVTVEVEPGANIQLKGSVYVAGNLFLNGNELEPIKIEAASPWFSVQFEGNGIVRFNYVDCDNGKYVLNAVDHCRFSEGSVKTLFATNSRIDNLTGYDSLGTLYGYFENCIIESHYSAFNYDDRHSFFTRCIFENGVTVNQVPIWADVEDWRVYNGKYYIQLYSTTLWTSALSIARTLGGDIACVESNEEIEFLRNSGLSGVLGLMRGSVKWVNGELVEDFINATSNGDVLALRNGELEFVIGFVFSIIEIPIEKINFETKEELQTIINGALEVAPSLIEKSVFGGTVTCEKRKIGVAPVNLSGNWWGTTDEKLIGEKINDFNDDPGRGIVAVYDYLPSAPTNVFPFVTDAYVLNAEGERVRVVGNETVTFVVEFNRDMDVSVPLRFRFGSSEPYAEYEVEGGYVTPRRWEGTYTLKTTIENGNQYFTIENGRSKDDIWLDLSKNSAKYSFEIDTTAAQAMIMQGTATETGIQLNWMQDDFDTLAGYNVYRSESEDGYYQRVNSTVIPYDTKEFFDDTVEPGKVYYYNFTVVQTDLSESTPSGKIVIMSMDTMAPDIYHSPVRTAYIGSNLIISATITDNLKLSGAKVFYRTIGSSEWRSVTMSAINSRYNAIIPASELSLDGLEYYIEAFDGLNYTYKGSENSAYQVTVKMAVDKNSLGDVDGDGVITTKDALMLLQAANDKLNLTEEQFLRADINGDKQLSAVEALRILQYVSGKITTILG